MRQEVENQFSIEHLPPDISDAVTKSPTITARMSNFFRGHKLETFSVVSLVGGILSWNPIIFVAGLGAGIASSFKKPSKN